jgi:hypothetical protein
MALENAQSSAYTGDFGQRNASMTKKKLLIVAGAGGSVNFGMPSVAAVHNLLDRAAESEYPLFSDEEENLYSWIHQQISHYWRDVAHRSTYRAPNFEDVLYAIYGMSSAFPGGPNISPLGALISRRHYPDHWWLRGQKLETNAFAFNQLACFLIDEVLKEFVQLCIDVPNKHSALLSDQAKFLDALRQEFDIAVVTVNYDDILYRALKPIVTGFNPQGIFEDTLLLNRGTSWPCFVHLHGSVHFHMPMTNGSLHDIHWEDNLAVQVHNLSRGRNSQNTTEGMEFPMSVIVAGYGKTSQILRRPFRTYYSELEHLSAESDAVLFLGYGFNDSHVNGAFERYRDSRLRRVVLIDYADDDAMTAHGASWSGESTATRAMGVFATRDHTMRWLGNSAPGQVRGLKLAFDFDRSSDPNTPLSIWYNGTADALKRPQAVLAELL